MSKSLNRVLAALQAAGVAAPILEMASEVRTAQQAATAAGCALDQISKSILFSGQTGLELFLTAGGNQIDTRLASELAGEPLVRADAAQVRTVTGFAIGGVAPIGHLTRLRVWMDPRLLQFDQVWAAAGTPRHIFAIPPAVLLHISGATAANFTA